MAKEPKTDDQFTPEKTQKRFEAALKGARIAGPKHKETADPKRATASKESKKPSKS